MCRDGSSNCSKTIKSKHPVWGSSKSSAPVDLFFRLCHSSVLYFIFFHIYVNYLKIARKQTYCSWNTTCCGYYCSKMQLKVNIKSWRVNFAGLQNQRVKNKRSSDPPHHLFMELWRKHLRWPLEAGSRSESYRLLLKLGALKRSRSLTVRYPEVEEIHSIRRDQELWRIYWIICQNLKIHQR